MWYSALIVSHIWRCTAVMPAVNWAAGKAATPRFCSGEESDKFEEHASRLARIVVDSGAYADETRASKKVRTSYK